MTSSVFCIPLKDIRPKLTLEICLFSEMGLRSINENVTLTGCQISFSKHRIESQAETDSKWRLQILKTYHQRSPVSVMSPR